MSGDSVDGFTQKERLLLDQIRQTFDELGPEAMQFMELIVKKSNARPTIDTQQSQPSEQPEQSQPQPYKDDLKKEKVGGSGVGGVPSLRAIERFFGRLSDSEVAYWRVRPVKSGDGIVPAEICAGDKEFRNDFHVVPVHVFASLKRMATQWQKRYVDNFGRRTKALDWPFPTTICQANCFGWLFSEDILHRLRLLANIHAARAKLEQTDTGTKRRRPDGAAEVITTVVKKKKNANGVGVLCENDDKPAKGAKRPPELYLYNYPRYIPRPPTEGAGPSDPLQPLPLMASTTEVVQRHYTSVVDRILNLVKFVPDDQTFTSVIVDQQLPILTPIPSTVATTTINPVNDVPTLTWSDMMKSASKGLKQRVSAGIGAVNTDEEDGGVEVVSHLPAFLFETLPTLQPRRNLTPLPVMVQEDAELFSGGRFSNKAKIRPETGVARVDVAQKVRGTLAADAIRNAIQHQNQTSPNDDQKTNVKYANNRLSMLRHFDDDDEKEQNEGNNYDEDDDDDEDYNYDNDNVQRKRKPRKINNVTLADVFSNHNDIDRFDD